MRWPIRGADMEVDKVADTMTNIEVHKVADMVVAEVADMMVDEVADTGLILRPPWRWTRWPT